MSVATGDASELYWLIVGPLPFLVLGVAGFLRQPENRMVWWLVGVGAAFGCDTALGDVFLPMAENHWGVTSSVTAAIALLEHWCAVAGPVAGVGLFGLFPSGRPERAYERVVIWTVALAAFLLPLLEAVSEANIAPVGGPPDNVPPVLYRALWVPALAPLAGPAEAVYRTYPVWPVIGVVLLALRYRRTDGAQRRKIRWLFLGLAVSVSLWIPAALLFQLADPDNAAAAAASEVLSILGLASTLGSLLVALFYTGVFGIDQPARRAFVHRVLRVSIAVVLAVLAVLAGVLVSRIAPTAVAVAVGGGRRGCGPGRSAPSGARRGPLGARRAAGGLRQPQPLRREPDPGARLGRAAPRPGRGGAPRPQPDLGPGNAGDGRRAVASSHGRHGIWRARPRPCRSSTGAAVLGRIECGPRSDGPLLAEDRRLLAYFAAQAAVGVHNLHLAAELSRRVEEVRVQAAELAASRDRVVAGQDAERRRIQRILHDGVQQEIVALSARAGLVRQQLLRGDPAAAEGLAEMQRDLATTLHDVREIAYAIHPPVLSDRGLLEAIEAQSSRLAVPMAVRADPRLRGVRFGEQIEATAWYVLAEALSNVVKHARASEVEVSLSQEDGRLGLVIRDDGCGFDPGRPRGLGLTGLSDRAGYRGRLADHHQRRGARDVGVRAHPGRPGAGAAGGEPAAGREHADA